MLLRTDILQKTDVGYPWVNNSQDQWISSESRVYHLHKSVPFTEKRPRKPENRTTFSDVPFVSDIFHWENPKSRVTSIANFQIKFPEIFVNGYKAPKRLLWLREAWQSTTSPVRGKAIVSSLNPFRHTCLLGMISTVSLPMSQNSLKGNKYCNGQCLECLSRAHLKRAKRWVLLGCHLNPTKLTAFGLVCFLSWMSPFLLLFLLLWIKW